MPNPGFWIQMNFYTNPDGPALLSVLLEGFYRAITDREASLNCGQTISRQASLSLFA
jgi:hypothetical protein